MDVCSGDTRHFVATIIINNATNRVPVEYKQKLHPSIRPSSARYNIVSSWKQFSSYLKGE